MRFGRFVKTLVAVAVALGAGLIITASASADTGKVKFRGEADVLGLRPGLTTSTFEYRKDRSIKTVAISTVGETVVAGPLTVECKPSTSDECQSLSGSFLLDVHVSDEVLRDVEVVPNPFAPGILADAIAGKLSGDLEGGLFVSSTPLGNPFITGSISMRIRGTATLLCVLPEPLGLLLPFTPVEVGACDGSNPLAGGPSLLPVRFAVDDHGEFELGPSVDIGVSGGHGKVRAQITGDLTASPVPGGVITISDATLLTP